MSVSGQDVKSQQSYFTTQIQVSKVNLWEGLIDTRLGTALDNESQVEGHTFRFEGNFVRPVDRRIVQDDLACLSCKKKGLH